MIVAGAPFQVREETVDGAINSNELVPFKSPVYVEISRDSAQEVE